MFPASQAVCWKPLESSWSWKWPGQWRPGHSGAGPYPAAVRGRAKYQDPLLCASTTHPSSHSQTLNHLWTPKHHGCLLGPWGNMSCPSLLCNPSQIMEIMEKCSVLSPFWARRRPEPSPQWAPQQEGVKAYCPTDASMGPQQGLGAMLCQDEMDGDPAQPSV